jgi:hypothetical protein
MSVPGIDVANAGPAPTLAAVPDATRRRLPLTTPGRMRLAATVTAVGILVVGAVAAVGAVVRRDTARAIASDAAPQLVDAEGLYTSLTSADATASTAFLRGGLESASIRQRYLADVDTAGRQLADLSRRGGLSGSGRDAVDVITRQLPVYTGLVESARANNRQGFPVGASYLRSASLLMRNDILPAATTIYEDSADRLDGRYHTGTARGHEMTIAVLAFVVLLLLVATQIYVARKTRRIFNVGLLTATVLLIVLSAWSISSFTHAQDALVRSNRNGASPLQILSTGRILSQRSLSDENLDLIQRGTDLSYATDFTDMARRLDVSGGHGVVALARDATTRAGDGQDGASLQRQLVFYLEDHQDVRGLLGYGKYNDAVNVTVGAEAGALSSADGTLAHAISVADNNLGTEATSADHSIRHVALIVLVLAALGAAAAVLGLRRRIREYA